MGTVFRKTFRIVGLVVVHWWVVKHWDFHGNFRVNVTCHFFVLFTRLLDWIVLIDSGMVWKISSLRTSFSRTKLSLAVLTDDVISGIEGTWIRTGGYGSSGANGIKNGILRNFTWEILLRILGGGVPPGSPNPDPFSDQKCNFPHPFSDQTSKIHIPLFRPGV